ncbi:putative Ran binding domain, PH-like domain superfamily, nuclear pore complex, NUP2/50/61 [Helianthus annuus]|nr:putative Ran binding domain, PH-like domain superfamily, nuclear pore complex, NUP2/50/61 [Helianthus annuus]
MIDHPPLQIKSSHCALGFIHSFIYILFSLTDLNNTTVTLPSNAFKIIVITFFFIIYMGDADSTIPPNKKRAAGRELSRDNPGLDDEEEVPGEETGTFKRASDEVLANRRIVKVKRGQTSETPSASSNPFAAIRLVPPATSTPAFAPSDKSQEIENPALGNDENGPAAEKENDGEKGSLTGNDGATPASEKENCEKGDTLVGNDQNATEAEKEKSEKKENLVENDGNTPVEEEKNESKDDVTTPASEKENKDGNDEKTPVDGSVNSFQQLSSSQNAFTGLAGTGFSNSTFSFGSIPQTNSPGFSSFSFGTNGNSSLFGNTDKKTEGSKITPAIMQEVQVETGEENEKAVFTADSILFEFIDGGWKERGKGELKVNVLTSGTRKARLVMRARGNYRLILNASIFPDMKLTNMEKKGITFACLNSTGEGQNGLSTFALKFKDASIVEEFRSVVMEHKGNPSTGALNLKTPENSPKESEE